MKILKTQILIFFWVLCCFKNIAQSKSNNEVATCWVELHLQFLKTNKGITPPIAARSLAYHNLALYESLVHGSKGYHSLVRQLNQLDKLPIPENKNLNWELCANAAQAHILDRLLPQMTEANQSQVKNLKQYFLDKYGLKTSPEIIKKSVQYGEELAEAVFQYAKRDGGHEAYLRNFPKNYVLATGACGWVPTSDQKTPLLPYWGDNRPFLKSNVAIKLPEPPRCTIEPSSDLYQQAYQVFEAQKNLTEEQKEIALFWADAPKETPTPAGHLLSITTQIIKKENLGLVQTAELYAKVGIATADAFILCWKCKYMHNILRPVTYIHTAIDPNWKPLLNTPDFPEYTSGHSSVSGAVGMVLADTFGEKYSFEDNTHQNRGFKSRKFNSFQEMAQEAALSRFYGGIHYQNSNIEGLKSGKVIGKNVCQLRFKNI